MANADDIIHCKLRLTERQQQCLNQYVGGREVVKASSNGPTSPQTRTERYMDITQYSRNFHQITQHYLGHSINAPTGRWQKNKDVHWYNRDHAQTQAERDEEIRKVKEAEAEALSVALYAIVFVHHSCRLLPRHKWLCPIIYKWSTNSGSSFSQLPVGPRS